MLCLFVDASSWKSTIIFLIRKKTNMYDSVINLESVVCGNAKLELEGK